MNRKIGVLGGGQLGRMILQVATNWDIDLYILDPNPKAPCAPLTPHFTVGDFRDYQTVLAFGQDLDIITIEIEDVNTQALQELEAQGKKVYPQPHIIECIQDKREQKLFYQQKGFPSAEFILLDQAEDISEHLDFLPAFQKMGKGGYDGKGVQYLAGAEDVGKAFPGKSLLEKAVDIHKEISVLVARNPQGEIKCFPPVEMVFDPELNLVDYLFAPAQIEPQFEQKAYDLAKDLVEEWNLVGLLAIEMFIDRQGNLLINEVAPRTHNSGHHSIEGNYTSQFEQYLRAILGLKLGNSKLRQAAAMLNILGEKGYEGPAHYKGLENLLAEEGVYVHLYGKKMTKPGRKMGHITILGSDVEELTKRIPEIRGTLKVISQA